MDLFNLLCMRKPNTGLIDILYLFVLPLIVVLLMLYGIINIVFNSGKKDSKSSKKFKRGVISFILFLVLGTILLFLLSANSNVVRDPCDQIGPLFSVTKALCNIIKIFVPLGFLLYSLYYVLILLFRKNDKQFKKALGKRIIRYIIIAILIFFMITFYDALIGLATKTSPSDGTNAVSWATCWCKD